MEQKPSVGRIVLYVSHGTPPQPDGTQVFESLPRAAIITAVHEGKPDPVHEVPRVDLCVFNPTGLFFNTLVRYDCAEQPDGGTWHWPPRV